MTMWLISLTWVLQAIVVRLQAPWGLWLYLIVSVIVLHRGLAHSC